MKLSDKRVQFTRCLGLLVVFGSGLGVALMLDQCKRTAREAKWNAGHCSFQLDEGRCERTAFDPYHNTPNSGTHRFSPIGILKSTHRLGLAADLYIMADGAISNSPEMYDLLGEYWKSLHPLARWGGDFSEQDLGHFSFEHKGRK